MATPKLTAHQEAIIESLKELVQANPDGLDLFIVPNTKKTQAIAPHPDMYRALTAADAAPHDNPITTQVGDTTVVATKKAVFITNPKVS